MLKYLDIKFFKISSKIKTGVLFAIMSFSLVVKIMSIINRTPVSSDCNMEKI